MGNHQRDDVDLIIGSKISKDSGTGGELGTESVVRQW